MKYKVGDHVRIKSIDWYYRYTTGTEVNCKHYALTYDMKKYCGQIMTISAVRRYSYDMTEDGGTNAWTDEMIEGLVEEPIILNGKEVMLKLADIELPSGTINIWELPDGYQFLDENGNVINATKIVLEKKKKEYPKTYKECCVVVGDTLKWDNPFRINRDTHPYIKHLDILIESFCALLICRDAYWKIAGEEMGLGKPWKPDWLDDDVVKHIISHDGKTYGTRGGRNYINYILAFPTEEMRDAFDENFKELINECKELL